MNKEYTLKELENISKKVIRVYQEIENRPWNSEVCTIELTRQLGDLAKLIMILENYYTKKEDPEIIKEKIGYELGDLIFLIIKLADHYKIDLEDYFLRGRREALKSKNVHPDF
jgi:hypothetical protein